MKLFFKYLSYAGVIGIIAANPAMAQSNDGGELLLPPAIYSSDGLNINPPAVTGSPVNSSDTAFEEALKKFEVLTPDQIRQVRKKIDKVDEATDGPLYPVNSVTRSIRVSLKSGERPANIKVSPGWVSTITFSDVTGQPWPVVSVVNGNPNAYTVQKTVSDDATNIINISAKTSYTPSNIAVNLAGAKVPILMTLEPTMGSVDARVDTQVDQRGPNASYDGVMGSGLAPVDDSTMLAFLDGVPPNGAKKLRTNDGSVQAWGYNEDVFIRTTKTLMSPAYLAVNHNVSGVYVYKIKNIPVINVSDNGRQQYVRIGR